MLSSIRSRRIMHVISVSLALCMFGYGLILKYGKNTEVSLPEEIQKAEYIHHEQDSLVQENLILNASDPD